jgi:hypothetical protein
MGLTSTDWRFRVLNSPALPGGLPHAELTLAERLRARGYATGMSGKWHLGIGEEGRFLPPAHGFDSFYGMGCTNVLACDPRRKLYPTSTLAEFVLRKAPELWVSVAVAVATGYALGWLRGAWLSRAGVGAALLFAWVWWYTGHLTLVNPLGCVLYRGTEIVQQPLTLVNLTQRVTADAQQFVRAAARAQRPFFLYLPFVKVHTALFTNDEFRGRSRSGFYGDNVEEMDWAVGQIMQTLRDEGVARNTITYFSSDNGPFLERGVEGGYAGVLRGAKGQNWEGGIRVPGIMHWPDGVAPGSVLGTAVSTMDVLPTTLAIVDAALGEKEGALEGLEEEEEEEVVAGERENIHLDGKDIRAWVPGLHGTPADEARARAGGVPHDFLFHYCGNDVHAVRIRGRYKLHYRTALAEDDALRPGSCPSSSICHCHNARTHNPPLIYDVLEDPGETTPLRGMLAEDVFNGLVEEAAAAVSRHTATIDYEQIPNQLQALGRPSLFPCCDKGKWGAWAALLYLDSTACRCNKDAPR